jgi:hypothetical protein
VISKGFFIYFCPNRQIIVGFVIKLSDSVLETKESLNKSKGAVNTHRNASSDVTVLAATPKEYIPLLTAEQRAQGANLPLDHLQDAMMTQWRQTHNDVAQDEGAEVTLSAFDGICYNCQQKGHRVNECPQERKNGNNNNNRSGRGGRGYKGRGNGG